MKRKTLVTVTLEVEMAGDPVDYVRRILQTLEWQHGAIVGADVDAVEEVPS